MAWQEGPKITKMWSLPPEQLMIRDKADTAQRKHTHTQGRRGRKMLSEGFREN